MTTTHDSDRIVRAWLDLMPDEAPDRAITAVLQAVESAPQQRPIRWLPWRSTPMNRLSIAVGAAAVVVVAGALILSRSGAQPSVGSPSSPLASVGPTASTVLPSGSALSAAGPIPSELRGRWMGDHRTLVATDAGTSMLFDAASLAFSQSNGNDTVVMRAGASAIGSGRIQLVSGAPAHGCARDDVGTYGWTRSASGRTLTITAERDDCTARSEAVAGVWWLMGCIVPDDNCLGALDAGTYMSQFIAPRVNPGGTWAANFGALSYQVPDGWANSSDRPDRFDLVPVAEMPPIANAG
jgi:hypothetical protein